MRHQPSQRRMKGLAGIPAMTVLLATSFLARGSTASAQQSPEAGLNEVGRTAVSTVDEGPLRTAVRRAGARLASAPVPQTAGAQDPSWIARHPVIVGTLAGTGAGLALSQVDAIGGLDHDPRVALIGAGAGAWGGLIASAVQQVRAREKVGVGTKIGIVAGAVGLIVLPALACYGAGGWRNFVLNEPGIQRWLTYRPWALGLSP